MDEAEDRRLAGCRKGGYRTAELGKSGFQTQTPEQRSRIGRLGGQTGIGGKTGGVIGGAITGPIVCTRRYTCPNCGKEGDGPIMFRWHFNRCRYGGSDDAPEAEQRAGS